MMSNPSTPIAKFVGVEGIGPVTVGRVTLNGVTSAAETPDARPNSDAATPAAITFRVALILASSKCSYYVLFASESAATSGALTSGPVVCNHEANRRPTRTDGKKRIN